MLNNILFVCTGNICRSPMAEGLFRHALPDRQVFSAGTDAVVGAPADPVAIQLLHERGIDITPHRARSIEGWMAIEFDLILTMEQGQKTFIEHRFPLAKGKVMRLGEYLHCDIPDPHGREVPAYRHACDLIVRAMDHWMQRLNTQQFPFPEPAAFPAS